MLINEFLLLHAPEKPSPTWTSERRSRFGGAEQRYASDAKMVSDFEDDDCQIDSEDEIIDRRSIGHYKTPGVENRRF